MPASSFSTGIRRKVAAIGTTNCEKEGAITSHGMLEDKENFSDQMLSHSSPSLCHRLNDHKQLLQPRRLANISTANVDVNSSGRMSPRTKQVPLTLAASGPMSTASLPSKRLRIEHYCSSNKSSSHRHTCENDVKGVYSQEEDICADNFEFHDNDKSS